MRIEAVIAHDKNTGIWKFSTNTTSVTREPVVVYATFTPSVSAPEHEVTVVDSEGVPRRELEQQCRNEARNWLVECDVKRFIDAHSDRAMNLLATARKVWPR